MASRTFVYDTAAGHPTLCRVGDLAGSMTIWDHVHMDPAIRAAADADVGVVIDVLAEASAWLAAQGIQQWPVRFAEDFIAAVAAEGNLYVAVVDSKIVGTVTLQWSDPLFWGERSDAGFLHRLAVRRASAGLGVKLIAWAEQVAMAKGREYLCLDTLKSNLRLRRYYEELGFQKVGEITGPATHPHTKAHGGWSAVLYERRASSLPI
jgi:GNAT superfamily N-acetyltransferase